MHPGLIRHVIYPAYRFAKRDRVVARLREMQGVQSLSPDQIRQHQWRKVSSLLHYAAAHVPYYKDLFKTLGAEPGDFKNEDDFRRLPVLRKRDITANADRMLSDVYPTNRLRPESTGGSTGENLSFYVDAGASEAGRANYIRMNRWIGIDIGERTAYLWGTAFDVPRSRRISNAVRNVLSNTLILSAYKMDARTVGLYAEKLRRFRPRLIVGYPSALVHFCETLVSGPGGRSSIAEAAPVAITSSGETLYEWQRQTLERTLGAPVYDHYGSREFGALARECKLRQGLHIACERVLIEEVPVKPGPSGGGYSELVITDLDNCGMPFVRYAIEDVGKITWKPCECGLGLPRLEAAVGRTLDIIQAPNGNFLGGTFWTILLRTLPGIRQFQVVQDRVDEITIALVPTDEFTGETRRYVIAKVEEACGQDMKVRFDIRTGLEPSPSGKHRFVVSKLRPLGRPEAES